MSDNRIRLFEGDVLLRGKHSAYVKFLVNDAKIFDKYIDVYLCGAVVGYLYSVKAVSYTHLDVYKRQFKGKKVFAGYYFRHI